jgi:pyruvate kinase
MTLALNKTKLVCTIGPATESTDILRALLRAGMNVARLNFSHGDFARHKTAIGNIRSAAVSPEEATCQGLQFSYGVSPVHEPEHLSDWDAFAVRWAQKEGLPKGLIVLTQGPSKRNPRTNPRLEIIDLRRP